jgi:hypothetical protein
LADASLLLNAVTSGNTRQAMRLRNLGDAWSAVTVNEEVYRYSHALAALGMLLQGIRFVGDYCRDHYQIRDLADKKGGKKM